MRYVTYLIFFCCLGRIRTLTKGARNLRATITPQGNLCSLLLQTLLLVSPQSFTLAGRFSVSAMQSYNLFSAPPNISTTFFQKIFHVFIYSLIFNILHLNIFFIFLLPVSDLFISRLLIPPAHHYFPLTSPAYEGVRFSIATQIS